MRRKGVVLLSYFVLFCYLVLFLFLFWCGYMKWKGERAEIARSPISSEMHVPIKLNKKKQKNKRHSFTYASDIL